SPGRAAGVIATYWHNASNTLASRLFMNVDSGQRLLEPRMLPNPTVAVPCRIEGMRFELSGASTHHTSAPCLVGNAAGPCVGDCHGNERSSSHARMTGLRLPRWTCKPSGSSHATHSHRVRGCRAL